MIRNGIKSEAIAELYDVRFRWDSYFRRFSAKICREHRESHPGCQAISIQRRLKRDLPGFIIRQYQGFVTIHHPDAKRGPCAW